MTKFLALLFLLFLVACKSTTYYVVRHAEKQSPGPNMSGDVPLSDAGMERAQALKEKLQRKVDFVTSTQTIRTKSTAEPLAKAINRNVHVYSHQDTALLRHYRNEKMNILFVGHSNTVDDLVNFFMDQKVLSDLPDSAYGDLFIIKKEEINSALPRIVLVNKKPCNARIFYFISLKYVKNPCSH